MKDVAVVREAEAMMDEMIARMAQRNGDWYKMAPSDECSEQISLEEFVLLCDFLTATHDERCRLENEGRMTEEEFETFDDKLIVLKNIAIELSSCLEEAYPIDAAALRACLELIFPEEENEY